MTKFPQSRHLVAASLAALVASAFIGGCQTTASSINPGPSAPVAFAVERVSPAVVRLDVVTDNFSNGQAGRSAASARASSSTPPGTC